MQRKGCKVVLKKKPQFRGNTPQLKLSLWDSMVKHNPRVVHNSGTVTPHIPCTENGTPLYIPTERFY